MKLGRSNSPYNTPMYGAACGPVKGQQLEDRGEGGGGCLTQGPGSEYFCRQRKFWPISLCPPSYEKLSVRVFKVVSQYVLFSPEQVVINFSPSLQHTTELWPVSTLNMGA
ncbi:hypothetical protein DPX16_9982 [Anabarilius grahami]|uniref:Uncharacterized protein n=1 Tax=Anabarilius grahami TaxID=495550 RepID=A0A3N0XXX5_ANAGA|nr:hypothetical protein DPX16_9982 [Anabarilius grahami]